MALTDCFLYRVTGITDCIVYFDNCVSCEPDSVSIPDGKIYYISHCTGNTTGITVTSGNSELITNSPTVYTFTACCPTVGVTDTISVLGKEFTTFPIWPTTGFSYYFSAATNVAESTSYYPCQIQGCFQLVGDDDTNTDYFYSCFEIDPTTAGSCIECSGLTHTGDACFSAITGCCLTDFCLSTHYTPYSGYDGNYEFVGTYDGYSYYTGGTAPGFIYFSTGTTKWCLSSSLGGSCDLFGKTPCQGTCPDICDEIFNGNICPTPTPSPTINCSLNDFSVFFDCDVISTPTPTPTQTSSPTPTPSVTPTINPCNLLDVDFVVVAFSSTPTPTPTPTPTSNLFSRNCVVSGDVVFNSFSGNIICPNETFWFTDCSTSVEYYSAGVVFSGGSLLTGQTFLGLVNSINTCVQYNGIVVGSSIDNIELYTLTGLDCSTCNVIAPSVTPTSTLTPTPSVSVTPSVTPTVTMTPNASPTPTPTNSPAPLTPYYIYKACYKPVSACSPNIYIVQTVQYPQMTTPGLTFQFAEVVSEIDNIYDKWGCWEYIGVFNGDPVSLQAYINLIGTVCTSTTPTLPFYITYNIDFFSSNGVSYTDPNPSTCNNGICSNNLLPIYAYGNCNGSGLNVQSIYLQYLPMDYPGTIVPVPGETFSYDCTCYEFIGVYLGRLDINNQPTTPLQVSSSGTPIPNSTNFEPHQYGNIFFKDGLIAGPYNDCFECKITPC